MKKWDNLADERTIEKTVTALKNNGFEVLVTKDGKEARNKVSEFLPKGAQALTMTSVTLDTIGVTEEVDKSGKYDSVRTKLNSMDRETQGREMQKLGASPEWALGSVHAVTSDGHVFIASNTGSQLPAYVYGADHVIWIVRTQKIVANDEEARARIYEYVLPRETVRARKAYGLPETFESFVSKLVTVNKEINPGRITILFVKEKLGF